MRILCHNIQNIINFENLIYTYKALVIILIYINTIWK
jgi:hypothetical protein